MSPRPSERADFLVELGTEELPPKALPELEARLRAPASTSRPRCAGLAHGGSNPSPRRAASRCWCARSLARQPDQQIKRRGPPVSAAFDAEGKPTRAAQAFAESCGVAVEAARARKEGKGEFLFHEGVKAGARHRELLPGIVQGARCAADPQAHALGRGRGEFVRPVHWLLMLFGPRCGAGDDPRHQPARDARPPLPRTRAAPLGTPADYVARAASAAACSPISPSAANASARRCWRAAGARRPRGRQRRAAR
jgi:hypothetical protein